MPLISSKEPSLDMKNAIASLCVFLGLILFLVVLHILSIETQGNVSSVMTTVFTVFLRIFEGVLIIWMAFMIINLLKWLAWSITTPTWKKQEIKRKKELAKVR